MDPVPVPRDEAFHDGPLQIPFHGCGGRARALKDLLSVPQRLWRAAVVPHVHRDGWGCGVGQGVGYPMAQGRAQGLMGNGGQVLEMGAFDCAPILKYRLRVPGPCISRGLGRARISSGGRARAKILDVNPNCPNWPKQ